MHTFSTTAAAAAHRETYFAPRVIIFLFALLLFIHAGPTKQLVGEWERAAALVGNSALVIKIIQGGTLFYMWSECLFGLVEEAGALTAALAVAVRPVAVYAFSAVRE